jgi:hypothetical protein
MPEARLIDLIQRDVDGETTPGERLELESLLERDAEARVYRSGIAAVATMLAETPPNEVPEGFTAGLMSAIRRRAAQQRDSTREPAPAAPFGSERRRRVAIRVGLGLAAAAVFAVVLAPSLYRALDSSQLRGTMAGPVTAGEAARAIDAGLETTVRAEATGRFVTLHFDAPAGSPRSVDVSFAPGALRLLVAEGGTAAPGAAGGVRISFDGSALTRFERSAGEAVSIGIEVHDGARASVTTIQIGETTNF